MAVGSVILFAVKKYTNSTVYAANNRENRDIGMIINNAVREEAPSAVRYSKLPTLRAAYLILLGKYSVSFR